MVSSAEIKVATPAATSDPTRNKLLMSDEFANRNKSWIPEQQPQSPTNSFAGVPVRITSGGPI